MVFPFMSIYLTHHLHFTGIQAGWVLSSYGCGSMAGALIGGWLSDRYGNFRIQFTSLVLSGIGWLLLAHVTDFHALLVLIFFQSTISDAFRPANGSSITMFTTSANRTQSYSLNRMAMNMGYTVGPAIGGLFATISYTWLFWADGLTCLTAAFVFLILFRQYFNRPLSQKETAAAGPDDQGRDSPLRDGIFLLFILCVILFAGVFFQMLFTLPLYYKDQYGINEAKVGSLMAVNGFVVFFLEMTFVYFVGSRIDNQKLILAGVLATGFSYIILNWVHHPAWLVLSMVIISLGEIMAMPFMQTYVANRAPQRSLGRYLAFYSFAYSTSMILSPLIGMWIIRSFGYATLWNICMIISVIAASALIAVFRIDKKTGHAVV